MISWVGKSQNDWSSLAIPYGVSQWMKRSAARMCGHKGLGVIRSCRLAGSRGCFVLCSGSSRVGGMKGTNPPEVAAHSCMGFSYRSRWSVGSPIALGEVLGVKLLKGVGDPIYCEILGLPYSKWTLHRLG